MTSNLSSVHKDDLHCQMQIQPEYEENLVNLVRKFSGIRIFDHQLEKFRKTICQGCRQLGLNSCDAYYQALQDGSLNSAIKDNLIAGITIGESYFFRDHAQMELLQNYILPELISMRRKQKLLNLRIWSAGCADGQELYSIVMLLKQLLPDIEKWNLHLLGTDINIYALSRALKACYSDWSFRSTDESIKDTFFTRQKNLWKINDALQHLTKFSYLNLYDDNFPSILSETNAMDLILCRNVFIYFDQQTARVVSKKFHQSLLPGGYLLQGASDIFENKVDDFQLQFHGDTCFFQKPDVLVDSNALETMDGQSIFTDQETSTETGPSLQEEQPQSTLSDQPVSKSDPLEDYKNIIKHLADENWEDALQDINNRIANGHNSAFIWQFKAKALANLGQSKEALKACKLSIQIDPQDKHSYFILGLIYMEARQYGKSKDAFGRVLYLDRQFVEAHYNLALLHFLQGKYKKAMKYMHNALGICEQENPDRCLHDAAGMTFGRLATILRSELRMYQLGQ